MAGLMHHSVLRASFLVFDMRNENFDLDSISSGRFYTLRVLSNASGLPASSIRRAVAEGDLAATRLRQSCNAPIRIRGSVFLAWLEQLEASAGPVLSPKEAGRANDRAIEGEQA